MKKARYVIVVVLAMLLAATGTWFYLAGRLVYASRQDTVLTIEQVQQLARLVTLNITVTDVQVKDLEGYTGGLRLVLLVKGSVELSSNLLNAYFARVDPVSKQAVLVLPPPIATRPCLDQERTRIWTIQRTGLWQILPSSAGEAELANRALQQAQQMVEEAGRQRALIEDARLRTEELMKEFFAALGWRVRVEWMDQVPAHAAASSLP